MLTAKYTCSFIHANTAGYQILPLYFWQNVEHVCFCMSLEALAIFYSMNSSGQETNILMMGH